MKAVNQSALRSYNRRKSHRPQGKKKVQNGIPTRAELRYMERVTGGKKRRVEPETEPQLPFPIEG